MAVTIPFNLNDHVRVKLTNYGKELIANDPDGAYPYSVDEDGWSEFQLWVLMELFGRHCYCGSVKLPFETPMKIVLE
jgi:hypothetical protein